MDFLRDIVVQNPRTTTEMNNSMVKFYHIVSTIYRIIFGVTGTKKMNPTFNRIKLYLYQRD